jgi:hypothetical protein
MQVVERNVVFRAPLFASAELRALREKLVRAVLPTDGTATAGTAKHATLTHLTPPTAPPPQAQPTRHNLNLSATGLPP